jgi:hypothetical protein
VVSDGNATSNSVAVTREMIEAAVKPIAAALHYDGVPAGRPHPLAVAEAALKAGLAARQ